MHVWHRLVYLVGVGVWRILTMLLGRKLLDWGKLRRCPWTALGRIHNPEALHGLLGPYLGLRCSGHIYLRRPCRLIDVVALGRWRVM